MKTSRVSRWQWMIKAGTAALLAGFVLLAALSARGDEPRWKKRTSAAANSKYEHRPSKTIRPALSHDQHTLAPIYEEVGVTLWKMRPSKEGDAREVRALDHPDDDSKSPEVELTPVRVDSDAPFVLGDKVRLSIETARQGYLYVIDREVYNDGTLGSAALIFPTTRLRNGDNKILPNTPLELPDWHDHPVYFKLASDSPQYAGEELIVLVAPQEIAELKGHIGRRPLPITDEQLAQWDKLATASLDKFELKGGAGKAYTRGEKEAGADRSRQLTHEDELPQTLYQVPVKPGAPLMLKIPFKIGK